MLNLKVSNFMNLKNHFFMKMGGVLLTSGTLLFSAPLSSTAWAADSTETVMKQTIMQGKKELLPVSSLMQSREHLW